MCHCLKVKHTSRWLSLTNNIFSFDYFHFWPPSRTLSPRLPDPPSSGRGQDEQGRAVRDGDEGIAPKSLLAIDGGGIRGVIALEILDRLQATLRAGSGDADLVLADAFDYIAGTSTGAIIAAGLSLGMSTDQLLTLYVEHGAEMFDRGRLRDRLHHAYDPDRLEAILKQHLGADTTLGSDRLRTLLLIVLRNATTDSPWPVSSNPRAKFNDRSLADCNLDLPLWQLVRASTAAPFYFPPETITLGNRDYVFVDGGLTPFNNPAFQLFTMATLDAYGLGWPTGEDRMLLVSVGTGNAEVPRPNLDDRDMHLGYHATSTVGALMSSAAAQQDLLCRALGRCRWGVAIDAEVGDLHHTSGLAATPLFSYVRYDMPLSTVTLHHLGLNHIRLADVVPIDQVDHIAAMREIGRGIAARAVHLDHMRGFLPRRRSTHPTARHSSA